MDFVNAVRPRGSYSASRLHPHTSRSGSLYGARAASTNQEALIGTTNRQTVIIAFTGGAAGGHTNRSRSYTHGRCRGRARAASPSSSSYSFIATTSFGCYMFVVDQTHLSSLPLVTLIQSDGASRLRTSLTIIAEFMKFVRQCRSDAVIDAYRLHFQLG